jgi:hypothetical protein
MMITSPVGLWVGSTRSDLTIDFEQDGSLKYVVKGTEIHGSWKPEGTNSVKISLNGNSYTLPFTRRDLKLKLRLPDEQVDTEFVQM